MNIPYRENVFPIHMAVQATSACAVKDIIKRNKDQLLSKVLISSESVAFNVCLQLHKIEGLCFIGSERRWDSSTLGPRSGDYVTLIGAWMRSKYCGQ